MIIMSFKTNTTIASTRMKCFISIILQMSMIIILPKENGNGPLYRIEAGLNKLDLSDLPFEPAKPFDVFLPKFKVDAKLVFF